MTDRLDALLLQLTLRLADANLLALRQQTRARFSPSLSYGRHFGPPCPKAKPAAVMILLEPSSLPARPHVTQYPTAQHPTAPDSLASNWASHWSIPLTVRPNHLPDHPGQVSLPGGRLEAGEDFVQAAQRELCEELGFASFPGQVIGELQPLHVYNSNYFVKPFLAIAREPLVYTPCEREVDRVLRLPLASLLNIELHQSGRFSRGRAAWQAPMLEIDGVAVWGATAIFLGELIGLLSPPQ
ncbi:NUDIX hydrolase [Aureliella helgolandensis]|uniref:Putative NUDIX hydrolase n=1 Tax=Aureliella helgolandensis TaxID=2527968 RepID=A0A518FZQ0_9BACT|nr:CoA pyrophosphatase [Aureliella helgolandensis]QDV21770.1 putative NUDIX hydrolase [Aureliella helgolandensis]